MTRRRIYLMRHGQVAYFVDGRVVDPHEVQLTDEGRRETQVDGCGAGGRSLSTA